MTCLTENEYQYLPLWAGGNDDETGGLFLDHEIPMMATGGFSAPGPQVHTESVASTNDSFSDINPSDSQSTVQGASNCATKSHNSEIMSVDSYDEIENPGLIENKLHMAETIQADRDNEYSFSAMNSDTEDCDV
jgi:hypothetical protein